MIVRPFFEVSALFFHGTPEEYRIAKRDHGEKRPLHGWYNAMRGAPVSFSHQGGIGSVIHVAICNDQGQPLYDQFLHFENVGAITVVVDFEERIGLILVDRPVIDDAANYNFPPTDFNSIGTALWEVPRGMPKVGENSEQTALREGSEEIGSPLRNCRRIGEIVAGNTTFLPARTPIFLAHIDEEEQLLVPNDKLEKIYQVKFFDQETIDRMIGENEIVCPITIAAIKKAQVAMART